MATVIQLLLHTSDNNDTEQVWQCAKIGQQMYYLNEVSIHSLSVPAILAMKEHRLHDLMSQSFVLNNVEKKLYPKEEKNFATTRKIANKYEAKGYKEGKAAGFEEGRQYERKELLQCIRRDMLNAGIDMRTITSIVGILDAEAK